MSDDPIRQRLRLNLEEAAADADYEYAVTEGIETVPEDRELQLMLAIVRGTDLDPWIENQREFPTAFPPEYGRRLEEEDDGPPPVYRRSAPL